MAGLGKVESLEGRHYWSISSLPLELLAALATLPCVAALGVPSERRRLSAGMLQGRHCFCGHAFSWHALGMPLPGKSLRRQN